MKYKKIIYVVFLAALICTVFSGCFDKREVDDLTYVIGMGIDKGTKEPLKLTVQYAIPTAMSGGGDGGGGESEGGAKSMGLATVETTTIYAGLNSINNFIGKQLNMSQAKIVVFSNEVAGAGKVDSYIDAMVRGREFRPNMSIAVSRGSAEDYLKSIKPKQEINPAKYYELKFSNYKFTGFYSNSQLYHFYNKSKSLGSNAVATLVGVNKTGSSKDIDTTKTTSDTGRSDPMMGDFKAGDLPRSGDIKGETMGLAVFKGSKMVGELSGTEATCYLIASGEYKSSIMTFNDPKSTGEYVSINLAQSRIPEYSINLDNGNPQINVKVKLEGDYLSIQSSNNYESEPQKGELERYMGVYLKDQITKFLNKTSKVFDSDICGFEKYARMKFMSNDDWVKYEWPLKYKNAVFNLDVDVKIRRPGLMIRSIKPPSI